MSIRGFAAHVKRVRDQRLRLERKVKELKATEAALLSDGVHLFDAEGVTLFANDRNGFKLVLREKPITSLDPDKWIDVLKSAVAYPDLVHKRVSANAVQRLADEGVPIPDGIELNHLRVLIPSSPRKREVA